MNIFFTNDCPKICAAYLDDKRVVKMVLESAQLLSGAKHLAGHKVTYKPTHLNHPCAIWVRESEANYAWLYQHFIALLGEYTARYGRVHACARLLGELKGGRVGAPTPHVNCTPHKNLPTQQAYMLTLCEKWEADKRPPTWYGQ